MLLKAIAIAMNFVSAFIGFITAQKNYHRPKRHLFENFFSNRNYWIVASMVVAFVLLNLLYANLMDDAEARNKKEYADQLNKSVIVINDSATRQYNKVIDKFEKINKELVDELKYIGYELDTANLTIKKLQDKINRPAPEITPTLDFMLANMKLERVGTDVMKYVIVVEAPTANVYDIDLELDVLISYKDGGTDYVRHATTKQKLYPLHSNIPKGEGTPVEGTITDVLHIPNRTHNDIETIYFYAHGSYKSSSGKPYKDVELIAHYNLSDPRFLGTPSPLFEQVVTRIKELKEGN